MDDRNSRSRPIWREVFELLKTAVQMVLLFVVISAVIGRFEIHQISMEPNFHEGQRVIVSKLDSIWSNLFLRSAQASTGRLRSPFAPQRGQIVVFYTTADRSGDALIKRVIGLPGDRIDMHDSKVFVNGTAIDEPYVFGQMTSCNRYCQPFILNPDTYFMMGDNRKDSLDSRDFGPIPRSQMVGRVVLRYWPLEKITPYL